MTIAQIKVRTVAAARQNLKPGQAASHATLAYGHKLSAVNFSDEG